jgi:CheY-like chemotaxis protein
MAKPRPLRVLLVEDDDRDAILTIRAFRLEQSVLLVRAETGEDALAQLAAPALRPHLILVDLSLPGIDGHAVINAVKADPELRRIPVIALTSSKSDEDVLRSWEAQVAGYLTKPVDLEEFRSLTAALVGWWSINELAS